MSAGKSVSTPKRLRGPSPPRYEQAPASPATAVRGGGFKWLGGAVPAWPDDERVYLESVIRS